jgi:hypothetical protein
MSNIDVEARISAPSHSHAWRTADGSSIRATVNLNQDNASALYFDDAGDARAVAAACTQAAEALDRLAAEGGQR